MTTRRTAMSFLVVVAGMLPMGLIGCSEAKTSWSSLGGGPKVMVTIPPYYSFTRGVAGNQAAVLCLCTTTGPHHYESTSQNTIDLSQADLLIANGLALDRFAGKIKDASNNQKLRFVELGQNLPKKLLLKNEEEEEKEQGHKEEGHHGHDEGEWDPHVWLGIEQAQQMVEDIGKQLSEANSANAADYKKGAADYCKKLADLKTYGLDKLKGKKNRKIIAFHDSLHYFAKNFDLEIAKVIERSPSVEPTDNEKNELVKACKDNQVRVIAIEPQYPASTAELLRDHLKKQGVEIELVVVDPLETANPEQLKKEGGDWYLNRMRENIDNLARSLR